MAIKGEFTPFQYDIRSHALSGCGGFVIESYSTHEIFTDIFEALADFEIVHWDVITNYRIEKHSDHVAKERLQLDTSFETKIPVATVPLGLLKLAEVGLTDVDGNPIPIALVLENFDEFTQDSQVMQSLINVVSANSQTGNIVIITTPRSRLDYHYDKLLPKLVRPLPDKKAIKTIGDNLLMGVELPIKKDETRQDALERLFPSKLREKTAEAALGLGERDIQTLYGLCIVQGKLDPEQLFETKVKLINKTNALVLYKPTEGFDSLCALDSLKEFLVNSVINPARPDIPAKGVLLVGLPGVGKSKFAQALGYEAKLPVVQFQIANLLGKYVGDSETNMRNALATIDAMSPCIVWIDEMEKALAGSSSGVSDGGVMSRSVGTMLTWLQDAKNGSFVVGTCNDIQGLSPPLMRAGRFDAIFFLDIPSKEDSRKIWDLYLKIYGLDKDLEMPDCDNWTGAEIEACCRKAAQWNSSLKMAAKYISPIYRVSEKQIKDLRSFAHNRFIDANVTGLYQDPAKKKDTATPTNNTPKVKVNTFGNANTRVNTDDEDEGDIAVPLKRKAAK
jgi:SpoVK/Ycf46/Vps4 family AAA+-type ATPase